VDGATQTLGDLSIGAPTIVSESDSLATVAQALLDRRTSCAVLDEPPLRIVTERDLAAAWAAGHNADDMVSVIAQAHPCWALVSTSLAEAAAFMIQQGIRHLVVFDIAGRPTGIVSMTHLFAVLANSQEPMALYGSFTAYMNQGALG